MTMTSEVAELETWQNNGQSVVVLARVGALGEVRKEVLAAGRSVQLTPRERAYNQDKAYDPEQDVFTNGTLTPVRLIEGSDIAQACADNPNLLTDAGMRSLVGVKGRSEAVRAAFAERLATITNTATLHRLLALAEEEDAPHSRVTAIAARIAELEAVPFAGPVGPDGGAPSSGDAPGGARIPSTGAAVTPR